MMDIFESLDTKDHQWKVLLCYNCALAFLYAPKGEAYSRRFVRPSVTEPCLANNFITTVAI